ncbi:MAG: hypothetical protein BRC49_12515 [Cyanobacteria bacterium SW_10_48_33]|nr:MAG: hypothetical protein BRC46_03245 [Cyanobacteria bacterium QS_6_48_18]PSP09503.1 MAG: hypothetical protein BRC49_12515 [Cyanobacteria bacterium SW_10_48_33]PSP20224.1 MAG: hypothetical protein BRC52_09085 [Cyanobacteria bacterium SW_5_48_44]
MKTSILLLARTGSTRLPGKLLRPVMGRPILDYQIERLQTAQRPNGLVLCTTQLAEDDALIELASRHEIANFRGNTEDVVERMLQAAYEYQVDFIISIGGDDLLCDPELVDLAIERFWQTKADFILFNDLPLGITPYGVKTEALKQLSEIKEGGTDGWERYFLETNRFQLEQIPVQDESLRRPELRMTLDYTEDFEFFKAVLEKLYPYRKNLSLRDVIELVDSQPKIAQLSQKRSQEWKNKHASFDIRVKPESSQQ